jgi:hypothetical protein
MRRRVQPGQCRSRISVGSSSRHGPLATICTSPSRATRTLLVHGLIPTMGLSRCNPKHVLSRGPHARLRCGRLRMWLRRRLRRWLWWRLLCPGCSPRCGPTFCNGSLMATWCPTQVPPSKLSYKASQIMFQEVLKLKSYFQKFYLKREIG